MGAPAAAIFFARCISIINCVYKDISLGVHSLPGFAAIEEISREEDIKGAVHYAEESHKRDNFSALAACKDSR
jgi:hypothetical protein